MEIIQKYKQCALIGSISALFFIILGFTGLFSSLENKLYDFSLRYRSHRERTDLVVFLDVDNDAIAANGVFPWPRSVMADGLLRLKEYGARGVIFDIEYVDKGHQGIDNISLEALPSDFNRTFSDISGGMSDVINALLSGQLGRAEALRFFSSYIEDGRQHLLQRALSIARDNDEYLAKASALYGNSWATLNMRDHPLEGEQAARRAMAEELFPAQVMTYHPKKNNIQSILPPIPSFARAARGAGFTRAHVDRDGVRRRIDLVLEHNGFWYLQLSLAPMVHYLGNPVIELGKSKLILRYAVLPTGVKKDIIIPLDSKNRMLIDWPTTSFEESFTHFSFAYFSQLEKAQAEIERITSILGFSENLYDFISRDATLAEVPALLYGILQLLEEANDERAIALAETSDDAFFRYVELRNEAWELLYRFRDLDFAGKITALGENLARGYPLEAAIVRSESVYLASLAKEILSSVEVFDSIQERLKKALSGKYCIVGQTDEGTTDIGMNPFYSEYINVGTQGAVIDTILSESFIIWLSPWWSALFCIITPILLFLFTNMKPVIRSSLGFISAVIILLFTFFLFRVSGVFLNPICLVFSLVSAVVVREIFAQTESDRERQFIRKAFSTYVSDDVVEEIIADPFKLQLGGTKRHMSAIFTDIQGFSTISEKLDPEQLVNLLNQYLTVMSDVILKERGTIDKYEGDAIIAFFGAPLELPDHAIRACLSAISIKRKEEELNRFFLEQNLSPSPLYTRVGINTGSMVAGNMGTKSKMNYTIMGNTVNMASRLEGVNKQYGTSILTTRATLDETGDLFLTRRLDKVRVVGINEPVQLYELLETKKESAEWQIEMVNHFDIAISLFEKQDWKTAAKFFKNALDCNSNDGPSKFYLNRCETYRKKHPDKDWDGVYNMDSK